MCVPTAQIAHRIRCQREEVSDVRSYGADCSPHYPNPSNEPSAPASKSLLDHLCKHARRLAEPGRYAIMCFVPSGIDPDIFLGTAATVEPPAPRGPPHFTAGMWGELTVE